MKFLILYINMFLLLNCAAQGTASGGPEDLEGPKLISIDPPNKSKNISLDQKITLSFNELLDPVSIQNSIKISNGHKIKVRGRHIIITPEKKWDQNAILTIYVSRKIRDYQRNIMSTPIQIAYSTSNVPIVNTQIMGHIIGYEKNKLVEIGLFNYPIHNESNPMQKVEVDNNGFFKFEFISYGKYVLNAIESNLTDFNKQIRKKKYAMQTSDYVRLTKEDEIQEIKMLLSEPIEKKEITSIEMMGQYDVNLIFSDLSEEKFMIDTLKTPGDSIKINLIKSNRLETYVLPEFNFLLPEILDTIGPKIVHYEKNENLISIEFSEPIRIKSNGIMQKKEMENFPIDFKKQESNKIFIIENEQKIKKIGLLGDHINDLSGNSMKDSIKYININDNHLKKTENIGGNVIGTITYFGEEPLIVEAQNIETNEIYSTYANELNFKLNNLKAGIYTLWAFESLHEKNNFTYFSGIWEPYQRAARFIIYPDSIDVRARWDIENININFD